VVQFDCHPEASVLCAAKDLGRERRVHCDAIIARFARFLTKLHHYPALGILRYRWNALRKDGLCLPQALKRVLIGKRLSQRWKRCGTKKPELFCATQNSELF
jgi:hypothetical protein